MVSSDQYAACSQEDLVQKLEKEKASKQKLRQALVSALHSRHLQVLAGSEAMPGRWFCTMLLVPSHTVNFHCSQGFHAHLCIFTLPASRQRHYSGHNGRQHDLTIPAPAA